ncbi:TRAP transporter small permease [Paenalcaligenes hominis]|uniref:TRAP transporter small permease n=1 Tax=Paenalcaligenes hominis TaxID=643674 RepID=UPI0035244443
MNMLKKVFKKIVNAINVITISIAELALVFLLLLTVYSSVSRYFFRSPSMYATEISLYLVIVSVWLASGFIHEENRHVSVEVLSNHFGNGMRIFSKWVANISIILFCLILVWAGYMVAETAFIRNYKSTSVLRFPLWITYSLIPIGGVLLGLTAIKSLISKDKDLPNQSEETESF